MPIRDRVKELRRVRASELRPNPRNWRTHPAGQRDALLGALAEVGFAGALLARELEDGSLELIDGHLRAETTPDQVVPVLVLDVNEDEAAIILATHDPLAAMAEADSRQFSSLISDLEIQSPAIQDMLDALKKQLEAPDETVEPAGDQSSSLVDMYQVLIECADENQQRALLARLSAEGYSCRALFA
jgi:hypothetical protein